MAAMPVAPAIAGPVLAAGADALAEARALYKQGQYAKAAAKYAEAAKEHPANPAILWNEGFAYRKLGRYAEALSAFEKAGKLDPTHSFASKPGKYEELVSSTRRKVKPIPAHRGSARRAAPPTKAAVLPEVAALGKSAVFVQEPNWARVNVSYLESLSGELQHKSAGKLPVKFLVTANEYRGGQLLRYATAMHRALHIDKGYLFVASRGGAAAVTGSTSAQELKAQSARVSRAVRDGDAARGLEQLARAVVK